MAETIGFFVESEWLFAIAFAGNDSLCPALIKPVPQRCAVVSLSPRSFFAGLAPRITSSASGQSCASPPVSRMERRRPLASATAWIFVLRPPRERPIACVCSPFFPRCRAVRLNMCAINHLRFCRSAAFRQSAKQPFPNTALGPAHKAIIDRRGRSVFRRAVAPSAATFDDMNNSADHAPIINS